MYVYWLRHDRRFACSFEIRLSLDFFANDPTNRFSILVIKVRGSPGLNAEGNHQNRRQTDCFEAENLRKSSIGVKRPINFMQVNFLSGGSVLLEVIDRHRMEAAACMMFP